MANNFTGYDSDWDTDGDGYDEDYIFPIDDIDAIIQERIQNIENALKENNKISDYNGIFDL